MVAEKDTSGHVTPIANIDSKIGTAHREIDTAG